MAKRCKLNGVVQKKVRLYSQKDVNTYVVASDLSQKLSIFVPLNNYILVVVLYLNLEYNCLTNFQKILN